MLSKQIIKGLSSKGALSNNARRVLVQSRMLATPSSPQGMATTVDSGSGPLSAPKDLDSQAIIAPLGTHLSALNIAQFSLTNQIPSDSTLVLSTNQQIQEDLFTWMHKLRHHSIHVFLTRCCLGLQINTVTLIREHTYMGGSLKMVLKKLEA